MTWIMIGLVGGSIVVSEHNSREACEGRAVVLRDKGISAKCVDMTNLGAGSLQFCSNPGCSINVPSLR